MFRQAVVGVCGGRASGIGVTTCQVSIWHSWRRTPCPLSPTALRRCSSASGEQGGPGALVPARYRGRELGVSATGRRLAYVGPGWISLKGGRQHHDTCCSFVTGRRSGVLAGCRGLPGEVWSSFSITAPGAGSDLRRIETWVAPADDGLI